MFSKSISATRTTQYGEADNNIKEFVGLPHLPSPQNPKRKSVRLSPLSNLISPKEEHVKGRALQFEVHKKERNDWKKGTMDF